MSPGYFAIIPANVRYSKELKPNAKLLYGEITALCSVEGFCWADNEYFAELYEVSKFTISRWISQLQEFGFIDVELLKSQGNKRRIMIENKVSSYKKKSLTPIDEKVNTSCANDQYLLTKKSIPIDEMSNSYKESNTISNTTSKRETRALDFFEENSPTLFEKFLMDYKSKIKKFEKFCEDFNDVFDTEKLEYDARVIRGRLNRYARNWVERQNTNNTKINHQENVFRPDLKRIG